MVGSSKILTVSYGTFSCTLEGFDDSFDTMKAIAEYFRDLAADDRYFGAEPPTPDAEMLARIAEREIARRVEARTEASGIVLRAALPEAAQTPAPVAEPVRAKPAPEPAPEALFVPPMPAPRDEPPAHADAESVAAKLQRIRAVVGRSAATTVSDSYVEDLPLAEVIADEPAAESLPEEFAEEATDLEFSEPIAVMDDAVVDDEEDAGLALSEPMLSAEMADDGIHEQVSDEGFEDQALVAEPQDDAVSEDDIVALEAMIASVDEADVEVGPDAEASEDDDAGWNEVDEASDAPGHGKVFQLTEALVVDDAETYDEDGFAEDDLAEDDDEALIAALSAEDDFDDVDLQDIAALDGIEELEAFSDIEDAELSDEDEAALLRDLAEADAEEGIDDDAEEDEAPMAQRAREVLGTEPDEDEAAMARILSQTDAEMAEPENKVRRDAIAHLKAAYAATEAARKLGEPDDGDEETRSVFRGDLDRVIRPVRHTPRPEGADLRAERTERPRAAPLRLVASQRIDIVQEEPRPVAPIQPVRPRRAELIERPQAAPAAAAPESFADYAEAVGAHSLAELLEAAAAYTSYVEGVDEFSRPQIMKKVRDLSPEDFNREDGLRSFGTLLRQGRIMKIRNGRFQVSDQTRFRPEPRAAQG